MNEWMDGGWITSDRLEVYFIHPQGENMFTTYMDVWIDGGVGVWMDRLIWGMAQQKISFSQTDFYFEMLTLLRHYCFVTH